MSVNSTEPHVLYETAGGVATITLSRPGAKNTLSPQMTDLLVDITARVEHDTAIRCVVIRGSGECFMAGGDVRHFHEALTTDRERHVADIEQRIVKSHLIMARLRRMPKPVIASTHVAVSGFGLSLVLASDLVFAAEGTTFVLAHRHIGLAPDGGASYFLPRIVGERKALELALLGNRFDEATAVQLGIVNWTVQPKDLADRTAQLAAQLANGPTAAMAHAKGLIRSSLDHGWDYMSADEARRAGILVRTHDHLEGVSAFLGKRRPEFTGT
jgi:2-(1,2-epoxy-1,2-dihydrophenyl)acetyl-CoA isomerase